MDVKALLSNAEIVGGVLLFLLFVYRQVKTGARDAWREEAEAQTAKSDRLAADVAALIEEVRLLRIENSGLRGEVAALRLENNELRDHIDVLINGRGTDA